MKINKQLGAGAIITACNSESNNVTWAAAGAIITSTGAGVCQSSVPASWTPIGWYGLGVGLIL